MDRERCDRMEFEQVVSAKHGAAYGVIAGDLHVHQPVGGPQPALYLWRPPDGGPAADADVSSLRDWLGGEARLAALWLGGVAGAEAPCVMRVAAGASDPAWRVVEARDDSGPAATPAGEAGLRLLVVVPRADERPHAWLTWVLSIALSHQEDRTVRIVFTAGGAEAWPALRAPLQGRQFETSSLTCTCGMAAS